jgi:hypothetical protein
MRKEITLGQLLSAAFGVLMAILAGWIAVKERLATMEEKQKNQDIEIMDIRIEMKQNAQETKYILQDLQKTTNQILVNLERKQDRK